MLIRLALLALAALPLFAEQTGSLSGTVLDLSGEPASSVPVAVIDQSGRLARRNLIAGPDGRFVISELRPGSYQVTVTSVTFGTRTATALIREGQETVLVFLPTEVTQFSAGTNLLPSDGRSVLDVVREAASVTGTGNNIHSAGLRAQSNLFVLDGLDINEPWKRGPMLVPPAETIQGVNLLQGFVPAEFGPGAGAAILMQSKAGSSIFHGNAFENFGNSVLDARNYFDGATKSTSLGNRFGANLAGPITNHNWFFFVSGEGERAKQGLTIISTVPTAAQKAGNIASTNIYDPLTIGSIGENVFARQPFANNQILPSRIPSAVQQFVALYPNPNLPGAANNFRYQPALVLNSGHLDLRSDKRISQNDTLFARFGYQGLDAESPGALGNADGNDAFEGASNSTTHTKTWAAVIVDNHELKPNILNQLRVGAAVFDTNIQSLSAIPTIDITGYASLGSVGSAPSQVRTANYQIDDQLTWTTGRHVWSFGAQAINRRANGTASDVSSRGQYIFTPDYTSFPGPGILNGATGDAFASFLLGFPAEVKRDVQFSPYQLRDWEWSGFAQDQFRWKRLTVQAGARYSFLPPVTEADDHLVNFNFSLTAPALNQFAGQDGVNSFGGLGLNRRAIAPRVGFAFQIDEATVLRGGFSKNFDTGTFLSMGRLARNAPYASQLDIVNGTFQVGANITAGLPAPDSTSLLSAAALNASGQAVNAIEPQNSTPYADQWDLILQRRLHRKLMFEIGGTGSMGVHLYAAWDANQPYPAPTPYGSPRYPFEPFHGRVNYLNLGGGSTYYGGETKLSGEVATGLAIQFSYAFAKSLDDAVEPDTTSASRPSGPQFIYDPRGNRSPSVYDVTHRAVLSALYRIPQASFFKNVPAFKSVTANWSVSTLVTLQSGFPFTPELATNSLNNGGFQLPNRVGQGTIANPSPSQWFDTSLTGAFRVPALYQYGNSGFGILRGPGLATVDASLVRSFRLTEKLRLDAQAEAFNLLNRANFALPDRILGTAASGTIDHTVTPPRQLQLSILVNF